jgi:hypothetical protein
MYPKYDSLLRFGLKVVLPLVGTALILYEAGRISEPQPLKTPERKGELSDVINQERPGISEAVDIYSPVTSEPDIISQER